MRKHGGEEAGGAGTSQYEASSFIHKTSMFQQRLMRYGTRIKQADKRQIGLRLEGGYGSS